MKTLYWRILAIILALIWAFMIVSNMYFAIVENHSLTEIKVTSAISAAMMVMFIFLIVYPKKFILYALGTCFLGIERLLEGASTEAYLIYVVGLFFAYTAGVLLKNKFITVIFFIAPVIALLFQYRLGTLILFDSIIDLIFIGSCALCSYFLIKENFIVTKKRMLKEINLACLTPEELGFIQDTLDGKSFSAIALGRYKSESSVKQIMVGIYKKIGIESKKELLELHKNNLLQFPE